jgi:hypothetical protein
MAYRMISIYHDDRRLGMVELFHPDDVRLLADQLMFFAGKLNESDDLYVIEDRIAQHYFRIGDRTIFGTGLVVGRAGNDFLPNRACRLPRSPKSSNSAASPNRSGGRKATFISRKLRGFSRLSS